MLTHSDSTRQLGEQWSDGEKNIADAMKLRKNGTELIKKGHKNIKKGKNEIKEGKSLIEEAKKQTKNGLLLQKNSEKQFNETLAPKGM